MTIHSPVYYYIRKVLTIQPIVQQYHIVGRVDQLNWNRIHFFHLGVKKTPENYSDALICAK